MGDFSQAAQERRAEDARRPHALRDQIDALIERIAWAAAGAGFAAALILHMGWAP